MNPNFWILVLVLATACARTVRDHKELPPIYEELYDSDEDIDINLDEATHIDNSHQVSLQKQRAANGSSWWKKCQISAISQQWLISTAACVFHLRYPYQKYARVAVRDPNHYYAIENIILSMDRDPTASNSKPKSYLKSSHLTPTHPKGIALIKTVKPMDAEYVRPIALWNMPEDPMDNAVILLTDPTYKNNWRANSLENVNYLIAYCGYHHTSPFHICARAYNPEQKRPSWDDLGTSLIKDGKLLGLLKQFSKVDHPYDTALVFEKVYMHTEFIRNITGLIGDVTHVTVAVSATTTPKEETTAAAGTEAAETTSTTRTTAKDETTPATTARPTEDATRIKARTSEITAATETTVAEGIIAKTKITAKTETTITAAAKNEATATQITASAAKATAVTRTRVNKAEPAAGSTTEPTTTETTTSDDIIDEDVAFSLYS